MAYFLSGVAVGLLLAVFAVRHLRVCKDCPFRLDDEGEPYD
jgi:hypothetical protein